MPKKLKILYLVTKDDIGGAQKYLSNLSSNLNHDEFEIKTLYGGKDIKWLSNSFEPHLLFLKDWLAILELIKICKKEQPDIIHLNSSKTGVLGSLAAFIYKLFRNPKSEIRNLKVIFTAHGWIFGPTNKLNWLERQFYIALHRLAGLFQHKIINVSEYDYSLAAQHKIAPPSKLRVIHNGIDAKINFLTKKSAREELISKISLVTSYQLLVTKPWIGSLGRLTKEKDYETLIKAASLVPNAYFLVIGDGPEKQGLNSKIKELKLEERFFIVEPSGDDAKYLKAFDIFALSSVKEGLPYVILEAAIAKIPIAATNVGGIPEIIKQPLVPPNNPEMLAKTIHAIIQDKKSAEKLVKENYDKTITEFNLQKMVEATQNLYREQ